MTSREGLKRQSPQRKLIQIKIFGSTMLIGLGFIQFSKIVKILSSLWVLNEELLDGSNLIDNNNGIGTVA